jgi:hypothetical protein
VWRVGAEWRLTLQQLLSNTHVTGVSGAVCFSGRVLSGRELSALAPRTVSRRGGGG